MLLALLIIGGIIVFSAIALIAYLNLNPQFGGKVRPEDLARFAKSKQWTGKQFENRIPADMSMSLPKGIKLLSDSFKRRDIRQPKEKLPVLPFDKAAFLEGDAPRFIWFGHSVIFLRMKGKNILIDPMMGDNATSIAPFATKRFSDKTLQIIDQPHEISVLCMSHDHYDHLDYKSIQKLKHKTKHFYVALGVSRHLEKWGIPAAKITEMDWSDKVQIEDIKLVFTESRHFSGRGLTDRYKSLWGGWIVQSDDANVYWSGDGGYGPHFKEIGEKYGPFDIGFMECGQYNPNWEDIHMYPEESVKAAGESKVKLAMAVHNTGFALAMHAWEEPHQRFKQVGIDQGMAVLRPEIGAIVEIGFGA